MTQSGHVTKAGKTAHCAKSGTNPPPPFAGGTLNVIEWT
jgi:hypothetical protein